MWMEKIANWSATKKRRNFLLCPGENGVLFQERRPQGYLASLNVDQQHTIFLTRG
jgi:hypothetical protein